MRILLIEDDALIGDGLKVGLEKLGFSIDWFTDGAEGEEALFQAPVCRSHPRFGPAEKGRSGDFAGLAA